MNFRHDPNRTPGVRDALRSGDQQTPGQCLEIKSAVEAVGKGTKIRFCILPEANAVVTATQSGLEVSRHRVDPRQLGHILAAHALTTQIRVMG
jgi:hypothetical protein